MWMWSLAAIMIGLGGAGSAPADQEPMVFSFFADLDGPWAFRMDPENIGEVEQWFSPDVTFYNAIQVPGTWDAQGFGAETDKLRHQFIGKAWYKREVEVPYGPRRFLHIGGVHRYAKVWVNGHCLGEHIGYLSPFEYEITDIAPAASKALITICVDSQQRWDVDTLTGCFDIIDYMDTHWGGIWGHIYIDGRSTGYLSDIFVEPRLSPTGCRVSATVNGDIPEDTPLKLDIAINRSGEPLASRTLPLGEALVSAPDAEEKRVVVDIDVPNAQPWTPSTPALHWASLSLDGPHSFAAAGGSQVRFGFRTIEINGPHVLLNGKPVFLRGYGDDCIYPETMAAPSDKEVYLERLQRIKDLGFNHVRHHSHLLPPEYYEACDEVGMLVSAEFPIAYQRFYDEASEAALDLYRTEWTAIIKRFRNHPSILDWSMANEMYKSMPIAPELYQIAKTLDPTRPVVDSDGFWTRDVANPERDRDTLDLFFTQFDVFTTPLDTPDKFALPGAPGKPVIAHEAGNYVTFPRLDQIDLFKHNFKPFWLTQARDKVAKMGLLGEAEQWSTNSERLYQLLHKSNVEAIRMNPHMSGYHWWLFQDYWTTSNGIVDPYFRPKPGIDHDYIRHFNGPIVLLQEGLRPVLRSGEEFTLKVLVSNFSPDALSKARLKYSLRLEDSTLMDRSRRIPYVAQGLLVELDEAEFPGCTVDRPFPIRLEATLSFGGTEIRNEWTSWLYPALSGPVKIDRPLIAAADLYPRLAPYGAAPLSESEPLPTGGVYVASHLTPAILDAAVSGAAVILVKPQGLLPTARTRFKSAWWKGSPSDNNAGTVVYDHPATRRMAPEGWCDTSWYSLLEGADGYLLDDLPSKPGVLIRGIEVASVCRNKGLLVEAGVGKGHIIFCGLNLEATLADGAPCPVAQWLTSCLIEHAASGPKPEATLPEAFLRERAITMPKFDLPYVEGFAKLLQNKGEDGAWFTCREERGPNLICRQTKQGSLIEWETAPVSAETPGGAATFVFAGGLGWISEPEAGGFMLAVNGQDMLAFDVRNGFGHWRSEDGAVELCLYPKKMTKEDTAGLFYLRLPASAFSPGKPVRLAVRSLATGSQRWFALHPYEGVLSE